jgi:radical SAM superfamily enzyme YgiQ (UPF0313 family)
MAKILLVKLSNASLYKDKNLTILEPLGLEYIAAAIDDEHEVQMMDLDYHTQDELQVKLRDFRPDFVGTTVSTPMVLEARHLATIARAILKDVKILIGGGHPSALPEQSLTDTQADIAIVGEGESVINSILIEEYQKTIYYGYAFDINDLNYPRRDLLPRDKYTSSYFIDGVKQHKCASVITSRGCPFQCNYCASKKILGSKVRYRDPIDIVDEIEHLISEYSIESILFLDDCFTLDKERTRAMCTEILKRDIKINWWLDTRVDTIDESLLQLMYESGCKLIVFGIEGGNQKILDRIGKQTRIPTIKSAFEMAHKAGIDTKANFMLGHLDETEADIMDSISLAKSLNATRYGFYLVLPLPGSKLYDIALERDVIFKDFSKFKWYECAPADISKVHADRLKELQQEAYKICPNKR